jgi:hypothetical protein
MTDIFETLFSAWGDPKPEGRAAKTNASLGTEFSRKIHIRHFSGITNGNIIRLIGFTEMGAPA